jgi:hypothetical protein
VELVVAVLILYPQKDQDAYGETDGQSCDIEEGIGFVFEDISVGEFEIGLEHEGAYLAAMARLSKNPCQICTLLIVSVLQRATRVVEFGNVTAGVRFRGAARPNIAVIS